MAHLARPGHHLEKATGPPQVPGQQPGRTPIAGRNFECFSEDPYLSGMLASAYIKGLQDQGIGACIKHFIANDQEFERESISSEVDERTLREIESACRKLSCVYPDICDNLNTDHTLDPDYDAEYFQSAFTCRDSADCVRKSSSAASVNESLRPAASSSDGRRLKWISEHGPQGPVSPIIQKLSEA